MASWSLILAALVVGITICVAIGYIVFLQPNPEFNVPDLPPSDAAVETPPDETSSTSLSLSPSSKPENASEATSVGLPADTFKFSDSLYARARVNVNLELSRSGNGVRNGFRRPDGRGSGQFAESALDTLYVARNRGRIDIVAF